MGRLNLEKSRKSSKRLARGHKAISDLSTSDSTRSGKPAQKKQIKKEKPQLKHKKTSVKKIPPISQRGPKLLKRNEVVVFEHTEYKWTGSFWVNIKDNIVAPQYTTGCLNNRYPDREGMQKISDKDPEKDQGEVAGRP